MLRISMFLTAAALALAAGWLAWQTVPASKAIRVRNAFLLRRGRVEDFRWTPVSPPPDYRIDRGRAPVAIENALKEAGIISLDGDWAKACAIVTMLVSHGRHERAIRADLATTYRGIVAGGGYCSDYVRVYLAAASAAALFCRQWAFSFDGFGGHGHTFVEVFNHQRGAWAFLDVHNNVYAVLKGNEAPLSALELRSALIESPAAIEFCPAGPGRPGFRYAGKLLDYYRRGAAEWYLWWGNDVIARDSIGLPPAIASVFGPIMHRLRSAFGRLPQIVAVATAENDERIAQMERLRRRVIGALLAIGVLGVLLAPQLSLVLRRMGG